LENQGPYTSLAPGESLTWIVKWYVREIPEKYKFSKPRKEILQHIYRFIK
jgi:hypothetical protein